MFHVSLSMNNQLTRRVDKRNPAVSIHTQFTASEHQNGPGHVVPEECPQVHDLQTSLCGAVLGSFT